MGHPAPGDVISHYRLLEQLGAGGMGVVWRAEDLTLGRKVALKFVADSLEMTAAATDRLVREARAAAALNHPGICTIYEVGEYRGKPFIAMELLEGQSLEAHISGGPLDSRRLVELAIQLADGLAAAHARGVIHRDIKPANIFIVSGKTAKILDFGIARLESGVAADAATIAGHAATQPGMMLGTPAYMAPEQARGEPANTRSDVFSLGSVLYELATGRPAFANASHALTFEAILNRQPTPIQTINPALQVDVIRIINKALEKDPALRFQSAADLLADLKRVRRDLDSGAAVASSGPSVGADGPSTSARRPTWRRAAIIAGLVGVSVIAGAAAMLTWRVMELRRSPAHGEATSILVLPLVNGASNPQLDDLTDGLTEALINRLSGIASLRVLARNTSFRFKDVDVDPTETGRRLGVKAVITGRVEQQGDTIRVGIELVEVATGSQLWGSRFNRAGAELLAIEEDLSRAIAESLRVRLSTAESTSLSRRPTDSVEAYRLYLTGRRHWNQRTPHDLLTAIDYFNRAIDADAAFALAYSGIAESYVLLPAQGIGALAPNEAMPRARVAAVKALELDPGIADAHTALAYVKLNYDWDWAGAALSFEQARVVRPIDATFWRAAFLAATGKPEDAIAEAKSAAALDPLSGIVSAGLSWMYHLAARFDDERREAEKALELNPRLAMAHWRLASALTALGRQQEAIEAQRRAVMHSGGSADMLAALSYVLARAGQHAEARETLDELLKTATTKYVSSLSVSLAHLALGDRTRALAALEAAHEERAWGLAFIGVEPFFDALRPEPRFSALLQRMRLPVKDH